jgi:localization factor PodJL
MLPMTATHARIGQQSPSEAAALAAAYAVSEAAETRMTMSQADEQKSFLSGLAARIRPGKAPAKTVAEPQFAESESPPLDPAMDIDPATANTPLEPGSGAPDINRILKKVREAQAAERQRGGDKKTGLTRPIFWLLRAVRQWLPPRKWKPSARAATGKQGGLLSVLKSRRRPILMAAGAVLLAIMSYPLVTGFLSGGGKDMAATDPAIVEPAALSMTSEVPAMDETGLADIQASEEVTENGLPESG